MAKLFYMEPLWYITAGETVQTIIVNGCNVVYLHYKNGYYSYIVGLENLKKFLDGDTNARLFCSDNTEDFENISKLFEDEEA
jgi:hypothetical protein